MLTAHPLIPSTGTSDDCNTVPSQPSSSSPPPLPPSRRMEKNSAAPHPFRCVINDKWHAYGYAPPFNLSSSSLPHNGRHHSSDRRKQLHRLHCMKVNRSQRIQPIHHRLRPIHNSHLDMSDPNIRRMFGLASSSSAGSKQAAKMMDTPMLQLLKVHRRHQNGIG